MVTRIIIEIDSPGEVRVTTDPGDASPSGSAAVVPDDVFERIQKYGGAAAEHMARFAEWAAAEGFEVTVSGSRKRRDIYFMTPPASGKRRKALCGLYPSPHARAAFHTLDASVADESDDIAVIYNNEGTPDEAPDGVRVRLQSASQVETAKRLLERALGEWDRT